MNRQEHRLWFGIVTLFPEMFDIVSRYGVTGKAVQRKLVAIHTENPRDFAEGKHKHVDAKPFGGGAGMLLMAQPLQAALTAAKQIAPPNTKTIYLTPQGKKLTQQAARDMSEARGLILLSGRYEGIDERVIESDVDEEWSIGDYVLTGGELPAMVLMDAVIRLLPNALGDVASVTEETFQDGLLKHPQFSKPRYLGNLGIPEVLLSGDHKAIQQWRLQQSLGRTMERRPDLLENRPMSENEKELLQQYLQEHHRHQ